MAQVKEEVNGAPSNEPAWTWPAPYWTELAAGQWQPVQQGQSPAATQPETPTSKAPEIRFTAELFCLN
jgi:hypothetical protein